MTYRALLGELDQWFARGVAAAGPGVVLCARGCVKCCHGPFDISPADARAVAAAVAHLDPPTRDALQSRAAIQRARYAAIEPTWAAPWNTDVLGEDRLDRLGDTLADEPCPALGGDGACLVYDARPATCRMTGLAMRTPQHGVIDNICPILDTSAAYAELAPTPFDLLKFEDAAERHDADAEAEGWVWTTVAGAVGKEGVVSRES